MPPAIRRDGAGACTTTPSHARQASFGRLVPSTRNWAGITSSRSELSWPMTAIAPRQHGQAVSSGASVTSIRGKCAGSAPRLTRRRATRSCLRAGSRCSVSASPCAMACSRLSRPSCSCSSGSRSDRAPNCMRRSCSSRCRSRSFCAASASRSAARWSRSATALSRSAQAASSSARSASAVLGSVGA